MVNIIIAFPSDDKFALFSSVLDEAGLSVFRQCTSGSAVKRAINQCRDGIVICSTRLPDCTADELAWDLQDRAMLLVVGRPQQLEMCEYPQLFRLAAPFSKGELTSAVNMLIQFYQMRLPKRDSQEKKLIAQAKEKLMQLPMWAGDRLFLERIAQPGPFFSLKLRYRGETLEGAWLNGKPLNI